MTENKITETLEVSNITDPVTDTTITEPAPKQKPKRGRKKADAELNVSETATTTTTEIVAEPEPEKPIPVTPAHATATGSGLKAGKTYTNENGIRLYASCVATNPAYRYMGSVAIWSDDTINNRVRITDACIHAGIHSKLIGWVNINELGDEINV